MEERGVQRIDDERVPQSAARIIRARKDMQQSGRSHRCSKTRCLPLDESALLQPPYITNNVYVCQLGVVHVCSEATCELFNATPDKTCPISGIQHAQVVSSYARNDPVTWYEPRAPATKRTKVVSDETPTLRKMQAQHEHNVLLKAGEIIKRLLFGMERVNLNNAIIEERKALAEKACEKYRRDQLEKRQLPFETELHKIRGAITGQPLPLCEFVHSEPLQQYYAKIILQQWKLIISYLKEDAKAVIIQKCDIETITVSTLYCMKDGIVYGDQTMLPRDGFLEAHLPDIGDLARYFGIERKCIQLGQQIITASITHNVKKGGGGMRVVTSSLSSDQKEQFERAKGFSKVPVKLDTNGETLFMPQSRNKKE